MGVLRRSNKGYLLIGEPGNSKTEFAKTLIEDIKKKQTQIKCTPLNSLVGYLKVDPVSVFIEEEHEIGGIKIPLPEYPLNPAYVEFISKFAQKFMNEDEAKEGQ